MRAYMSALGLLALSWATRARADDAIDAWARWAVAPKVWKGQVVPLPDARARPSEPSGTLDSRDWPVRLHAPRESSAVRSASVLQALEQAYRDWYEQAWPMPAPDLGLGGTNAFDAYLVSQLDARADGRVDQPVVWADFDTAYAHALIASELPESELLVCTRSAFAQAALRALDPAEADSLVRATAEFWAWHGTGQPGCSDALVAGQRAPERSMLASDLVAAGSGALFFALLSERAAGGSTDFVRALWELTRQRSRGLVDADRLRGSPDVWEVLSQALRLDGDELADMIGEFAVARFFSGPLRRREAASYRVFASLPPDAAVPLLADLSLDQLPRHVRTAADSGVEALASAYVRVSTGGRSRSAELRIWLRGELGADWSLIALRLGADGRELGRTRAPVRPVPESFVPLLLEPDTHEVIVVVTQLPHGTPDADQPALSVHGFDLSMALAPTF